MKCPACQKQDNDHVVDTKRRDDCIWRRRECLECGHRWDTEERPATTVPLSPQRRSEIGRQGAAVRWAKKHLAISR